MFEKSVQKESDDHRSSDEWCHEMLQLRVLNPLFNSYHSFLTLPLVQASIWSYTAWTSIDQTYRYQNQII